MSDKIYSLRDTDIELLAKALYGEGVIRSGWVPITTQKIRNFLERREKGALLAGRPSDSIEKTS